MKVYKIELKNNEDTNKEFSLYFYLDVVLGDIKEKVNGNICVNKVSNKIEAVNKLNNYNVYAQLFEKVQDKLEEVNIESFTGDKSEFIGNGTIQNPEGIYLEQLSNSTGLRQGSMHSAKK